MILRDATPNFFQRRGVSAGRVCALVLAGWHLLFAAASGAPVVQNTFSAVDDASVKSGFSAKKNFGREAFLELQTSRGTTSEAYVKFDLTGVDASVKEVRLRFYAGMEKAEAATILVRSTATPNWLESAITWKDKPEQLTTIGSISITEPSAQWRELDITSFVKAELAARHDMISLVLVAGDSFGKISIRAHEAESNGPEIVTTRPLFMAKVVFQPKEKVVPAGYVADSGASFGEQTKAGLRFGWSVNVSPYVKDRNRPEQDDPKPVRGPDPRYMGVAFMDHADMATPAKWEIAVPNGKYKVHLVAGDACYYDSIYGINVEEVLLVDGIPDSSKPWIEGAEIVTVKDGRLTVSGGSKGINNKLCFLEVAELFAP